MASKFQMVDPMTAMQGGAPSLQEAVAEEAERRVASAAEDLRVRHDRGEVSTEVSATGPTGTAYREAAAAEAEQRRAAAQLRREERQRAEAEAAAAADAARQRRDLREGDTEEVGDDAGSELRRLREARLRQLRDAQKERADDLARGHGEFQEVTQDEFLPAVTSSRRVVCHFYHRDFPRCTIMDTHLRKLATRHVECRFIRINCEKAPFFVHKLAVRVIPTLVLFHEGVSSARVTGFEGLAETMPEGREDEWRTPALARLLLRHGMLDEENLEREDKTPNERMADMRAMLMAGGLDDDEDLFDDEA